MIIPEEKIFILTAEMASRIAAGVVSDPNWIGGPKDAAKVGLETACEILRMLTLQPESKEPIIDK